MSKRDSVVQITRMWIQISATLYKFRVYKKSNKKLYTYTYSIQIGGQYLPVSDSKTYWQNITF